MLNRLAGDWLRALIAMALGAVALLYRAEALHAQAGPPTFKTSHAFRCRFGKGAQTSWYEDEPEIYADEFGKDNVVTYYALDRKKGRARILGNEGAGDVLLATRPTGLNLIEYTDSGNMIFTTIFAFPNAAGEFKAVMSRHLLFPQGPFFSQYTGVCTSVEL